GTRAQEHDPSAALQRVRDEVGRAGDGRALPEGGDEGPPVFVEEKAPHARRGQRVQPLAARVAALREEPGPRRGGRPLHLLTLSTTLARMASASRITATSSIVW